jgi:CDP-paratose 2-epimerase
LHSVGPLEFIEGNTVDAGLLKEAVLKSRPEVVYHLAGQVAMTTSLRDPWGDFQTNVVGTLNLLECLRLNLPDTALLYSSSNKVYGALATVRLVEKAFRYEAPDHPQGLDESIPLDFRTPYGCSKGAADQYVLEYARTYGLRTAVFRHSTIYGGRQHSTFDQGWVGWFCLQALAQKKDPATAPFTISGDGKQVRDLLYVDDAVEAYLLAAERMERIAGGAFNIGGGVANSSSLLELFQELEVRLAIKLRFSRLEWRHEDQKYFVAGISKFHASTGWEPRVSKKDGVGKTLEWLGSRPCPGAGR